MAVSRDPNPYVSGGFARAGVLTNTAAADAANSERGDRERIRTSLLR
jgi:hypothetical protein